MQEPEMLTSREVAQMLRMKPETLAMKAHIGEIRAVFEAQLAVMGATKLKKKAVKSRPLPMHLEGVSALTAWKHEQQRQLGAEWHPQIPVLSSPVRQKDGSRRAIACETAWRTLKALYKDVGMKGFWGMHSLRRTLCQIADKISAMWI